MAKGVGRKCEEDGNRKNMEIGARCKWEYKLKFERKRGMEARRRNCHQHENGSKTEMEARWKCDQDGNVCTTEMGAA